MAAQKQTEKLAGNKEVSLGHKQQILPQQFWMKLVHDVLAGEVKPSWPASV